MVGVFVTGTDTGVGKTLAAACLVKAWNARYWKPIQTGLAEPDNDDSATVARLTELPPERLIPPAYRLAAPLSPHAAAALEGVTITLDAFPLPAPPVCAPILGRPLVIEGAGGVLVPLNDHHLMIDLIERLGLPVVLVARTGLGTINHTLLSLLALRQRRLIIAGVVLSGPANPGNRAAIANFGQIPIVAELPWLERIDAAGVAAIARKHIPPLTAIRNSQLPGRQHNEAVRSYCDFYWSEVR
ncbi:ATP-dependent dethiobiotin synthetase BioD [uncultured Gammaproteobacteria bacterium]